VREEAVMVIDSPNPYRAFIRHAVVAANCAEAFAFGYALADDLSYFGRISGAAALSATTCL
jgi:hypothetical protein